jgi:hypothetical protein
MTTEDQILQRVTRIESRICRISDHWGIKTNSPDKNMSIYYENAKIVNVDIDVMDSALSDILRFLRDQGKQDKVAHIFFGGSQVATIYPPVLS